MMKSFTILSHNTFWFQGVPFLTDKPPAPDPQIVEHLCGIYRAADADVICLQEIQSRETFEIVSRHLEMSGSYCPGKELPQYGGAIFWKSNHGREIHNSGGSWEATQRMWQIVEIRAATIDLRICNIHLPSSRQLGPERAAIQRVAEIRSAIRSCEPAPDVIAGDFNEHPDGLVGGYLAENGYIDTAVISGSAGISTNYGAKRGDYLWIHRAMSAGFMEYTVAEKQAIAFVKPDKHQLSDHLPLWISLEMP